MSGEEDKKDEKKENEENKIVILDKDEVVEPVEDKRELKDIEIDKLTVSSANPRKTDIEKDINIMIDSLRRYGLITPLEVRRRGDFYEVNQGQRRLMAARALGWKKIRCWIVPDESNEEEDSIRSFIEQMDRLDLPPKDRSRLVNEFAEKYDYDWLRLSEILNRPVRTLKDWADFEKVPEKIQEMVFEKRIGEGYARKLVRFSEVDPGEMLKIAEKISTVQGKNKDAIINSVRHSPRITAEEISKKIDESKEELTITIVFKAKIAKVIKEESESRFEDPPSFIRSVIREYLEDKGLLQ